MPLQKRISDGLSPLEGKVDGTDGFFVGLHSRRNFFAVHTLPTLANKFATFNANGTLGTIVSTPSPAVGAFSGRFAPDGARLVTDNTPGTDNASFLSS